MRNEPHRKPDPEQDSPISRLKYNNWYKRAFTNSAEALGEMSLADVLRLLWSARLYLLAGAAAGIVASCILWGISTPHYRASLTLSPANPMNGAQFSRLLNDGENFSPLSFLLQRVGSGNTPDFVRFEAMIHGQAVAADLLENEVVLQGLALDKPYLWSRPQTAWTAAQFSEYLARRITLESLPGNGLRRLRYSHPDPRFAAFLLSELYQETDTMIRHKTKGETLGRIAYLQAELSKASNPEHRRALTDLLLEQERLNMLVSIDQPYAADAVEAASPSSRPLWPNIPLSACMLVLAGMVVGFAVFGLRRT